MVGVSNDDVIASAEALLNPHGVAGRLFGDVAAALVTDSGNHYSGVCIDTPNTGLCAERAAIAAMVTAGEHRITKVVAVWRDPSAGSLHVLPPCGTCREFMRQVDPENLDAQIVLGRRESAALRDLLPRHDWPHRLD